MGWLRQAVTCTCRSQLLKLTISPFLSPTDELLTESNIRNAATRWPDLAARRDLGSFTTGWTATGVPAHGSRLIKVT